MDIKALSRHRRSVASGTARLLHPSYQFATLLLPPQSRRNHSIRAALPLQSSLEYSTLLAATVSFHNMPSVEETSVDNSRTEEAVKENKKEKPLLSTTLVDAQPQYAGSHTSTTPIASHNHISPPPAPLTHSCLSSMFAFSVRAHCLCPVAGQCLFDTCDCRFFIGTSGSCTACSHPNLYHLVKPNRDDVLTRQLEAERQKQLFLKRKQREQREQQEKQRADAAALPTGPLPNNNPCSVGGCDCARFTSPAPTAAVVAASDEAGGAAIGRGLTSGQASVASSPKATAIVSSEGASGGLSSPSSSGSVVVDSKAHLLPRVCRKCKHADMYHIKRADEDDKKKGAKGKAPAKKK